MNPDFLVVGAGPFGLTVARQLAEGGRRVLVIDKRCHIGGNAHSAIDPPTGIEVHPYGPHLFHTSDQQVWEFVSRFSQFTNYQHRVWTTHAGQVYPLPINLATINQFYGSSYSPAQARAQMAQVALSIGDDGGQEGQPVTSIYPDLFEAFIRGYSTKQWGVDPALLPAATIKRLPLRFNYDSRYFSDPFQGLPVDGYHQLWQRLADHELIDLELDCDFFDPAVAVAQRRVVGQLPVVYSGPLDRFFGYSLGELAWRSVNWDWAHHQTGDYQGCAVMNFADLDVPHTRVIEFRHFYPERDYPPDITVTATEFPGPTGPEDEPFYPVNGSADAERLARYRQLARELPDIHFGGRLGGYQYLDMDKAIANGLALADRLLAKPVH